MSRGAQQAQPWSISWAGPGPWVVAMAFRLWLTWSSDARRLSTLTPDDAYYYFGVARNLASGAGSTFDGVTPTNGYQPLWAACCTFLAWAWDVGLSAPARWPMLPRLAITLQVLCGTVALTMSGALAARMSGRCHAALWAWLLAVNPLTVYATCDGMEGGLAMLGTSSVAWALWRTASSAQLRDGALLGFCLAFALLARLDLALLVPLSGLALLSRRGGARLVSVMLLPPLSALATYLVVNDRLFDTAIPISAWLKDSFPHLGGRHWSWIALHPVPGALALGCMGAWWWARRSLLDVGTRSTLGVAAAFTVIHYSHTLLFMRGDVWKWHFAGYWPLGCVAAAVVLARSIAPPNERAWWWLAGVALAAQMVGEQRYLAFRDQRAFMGSLYDAAAEVSREVDADQLVAMSDAGVFGYYRPGVLILDGLVLNRDYQERLAREGLAAYLRQRGAHYLGVRFEGPVGLAPGYGTYGYVQDSMLFGDDVGGAVELRESDERVRMELRAADGSLLRTILVFALADAPTQDG